MANLSIRRGEPREPGLARTWDPLRAMDPFQMIREMMSGDVFGGLVPTTSEIFAPDIEVKETKDAFKVCADLPGVKEGDVMVDVTGNRLTVSGKREEERRDEGDRYFAYERSYGSFSRSLSLPEGADMENVRADLKNGVLEITVPKKAEVQPRRVQIGKGEAQEEAREAQKPAKKAA
jgi:HSP20 family protein